jgi:hypothetical protein
VREDEDGGLTAYHSSPGGGTWAASVEITPLAPAVALDIWIAWSPDLLRLGVFDRQQPERRTHAEGRRSDVELWLAEDGSIVEVGSGTRGVRAYSSGGTLVSPPAIALWRDTLEAVRILLEGESPEGFAYEAVVSNAALGMLATGFETYCQERFTEIDHEGVSCDAVGVLRRFANAEEREQLAHGQTPEVLAEAAAKRESPVFSLVTRVNFLNYEACKDAYRVGYALKFGEHLGVTSQVLERVQRLLRYRHRVVHISPLLGMLNAPNVPPEEPEFASRAFAESARSTIDELVQALHTATLRLRP